jgi:hypothetical protein
MQATARKPRRYQETAPWPAAGRRGGVADGIDDIRFFAAQPKRRHRVRRATAMERQSIQPSGDYEAVAVVQLAEDGRRRRALIELRGIDIDSIDEAEAAGLFGDVVAHGWSKVEYEG